MAATARVAVSAFICEPDEVLSICTIVNKKRDFSLFYSLDYEIWIPRFTRLKHWMWEEMIYLYHIMLPYESDPSLNYSVYLYRCLRCTELAMHRARGETVFH